MVNVSRTFTVDRPRDQVVTYLRDFANAAEWDPGTVECTQNTRGPIGLGTTWHNKTKLYGISTELTYELTRDDPDHVVFTGSNKTATTTDDLSFTDAGNGRTSITYAATVDFQRFGAIAEPIFGVIFNRLADSVPKEMTKALEGRSN
ncbi:MULTISPECIES: SRPBCC family protein [unclassified Gordonia (in: high G+C Gram-positive bacteria)]|uniref:SRPBCC family protein n=1 Tax=unclassified Gordonia (in: high G+C Gram-positive bacteria) TaxID=2657482 RepID=UPI0009ABEAD6|nr:MULTISPECIES: SRPBCC family protein [unclassified Gordonia (in: high G+C Gram-positive bacteria)]MDF3281476.1 SRPBCC family protein [Gordonia sp. N1V]OPX17227.1 polyketide cyclase [Gordonia sp. i37]